MKKILCIFLMILIACTPLLTPTTAYAVASDELIFDGAFNETTSIAKTSTTNNYDKSYAESHIWYSPSTLNTIKKDGNNSVLKFGNHLHQSVKINSNRTYLLKFKAKDATGNITITPSLRNLKNRNTVLATGEKIEVSPTVSNWIEYTSYIEIGTLENGIECSLRLENSNTANSVLIDDISLKVKRYSVTANALDKLGSGKVTYKNAGIGATTSVYGVARMGEDVLSHNPDLVLLDFSTNDQDTYDYAYSYEAVLRTLSAKKVATIAILYGPRVRSTENGILRGENRLNKHLPTLIYYQIPTIEFYNTMWDHYLDADGDGKNETDDIIQWSDIWADYIHPNTAGHRLAAGAISYYITQVSPNSTDLATSLPEECFFKKANYYIGSINYQSNSADFEYTGEGYSCITTSTNDPNGGSASATWKPWKIDKDGYITFTVKKCKSLSYIRAASVTERVAEIYINGELYTTDIATNSGYTDAKPLAWTSTLYYFDGNEDITFTIKCTSDVPFIIYNLQFAVGE